MYKKIWEGENPEKLSLLMIVTLEAPCKAHLAINMPWRWWRDTGHISGQPSVNQQNALERRREKRNRHGGLVLMTLGDVRESTKQTITQLLAFKTTLKPFLS